MKNSEREKLQILPFEYFDTYQNEIDFDMIEAFDRLPDKHQLSTETFNFYTSVAAAYSSKIEGEQIEVDSFLKSRMKPGIFEKDYTKKTDDLLDAYLFAQKARLNFDNVLKAHSLLSKHFLRENVRGRIRHGMEFILDKEDRIVYVAARPEIVKNEMAKLFEDIKEILKSKTTIKESFYFATIIHLVFLKIHPFEDGNGRTARLLEKWFLSQKLGKKAWSIQSEKFYYNNLSDYYQNLHIGYDYQSIDFDKCLPILRMFVDSFTKSIS